MNEKLKIDAILLDLDGTILDTKPAYIEAAKIAFQVTGQQPPANEVALEIPKRIEQKKPLADMVKGNTEEFLKTYIHAFYTITYANTKPIAKAKETLAQLAVKAKLAVITMRFMPKTAVQAELEQHGLAKFFTEITTSLDICRPKPNPEALITTLCTLETKACDCLIVGDSIIDIQAGKAANMKTVAVLSGLYSEQELLEANPDFILKNIAELPQLIR